MEEVMEQTTIKLTKDLQVVEKAQVHRAFPVRRISTGRGQHIKRFYVDYEVCGVSAICYDTSMNVF